MEADGEGEDGTQTEWRGDEVEGLPDDQSAAAAAGSHERGEEEVNGAKGDTPQLPDEPYREKEGNIHSEQTSNSSQQRQQ